MKPVPSTLEKKWLLLPIIAGTIMFFLVTGGRILNPVYIDWLMQGDPAQHWLGWQFFRTSPLLQWPIGANAGFGREISSSIVFTDSIPVMALIFKLLNPLLPTDFQYFGLWILICFVLQAVMSWQLLSLFTREKSLIAIGTLFFLIAPAFLWRLHGHYALFSHWLLLAGLYLYFSDEFKLRRWLPLVAVAVLIHAYLTAMVLALAITDALHRRYLKQNTTLRSLLAVISILAVAVLTMWAAGYFMVGSGVSSGGFGTYRMNILSPIDPDWSGFGPYGTWSRILPDLPGMIGDYEGYNYLGAGMLALITVAIIKRVKDRDLTVNKKVLPLLILSFALFAYAVSNRVAFGDHELLSYRLPNVIERLAETFRASGRFFWPITYMIYAAVLVTVFKAFRRRVALAMCAALFVLQVADFQNAWQFFRFKFTQAAAWVSPLSSPLWSEVSARYKTIIVVPPENGGKDWMPISQFAATHGMSTNAGYFARVDTVIQNHSRDELTAAVQHAAYDPEYLYIFNDDHLWKEATKHPTPGDLVGVLDGYRILAPNFGSCKDCDLSDLVTVSDSRLPAFSAGVVSFGTQGNTILEQSRGWSTPDEHGSWSVGDSASVDIQLPPLPARKLALKISGQGFLTKGHFVQNVQVIANGIPLQKLRYDLESPSPRIVTLPSNLPINADGKLTITFKIENPVSPLELGVSQDPRHVGINLQSLEVLSRE